MNIAETFLPLYEKRKTEHKEICLIKDEVPVFFEKIVLKQPDDILEMDYLIMNEMQQVTLLDDVTKADILYMGNDYETDVIGAKLVF